MSDDEDMGMDRDTGEVPVVGEGAGAGEDAREPVRQGEGSRTIRRSEQRRQRQRQRRRWVKVLGGAVLVVLLAFVFWYELESHAPGSAGRREVIQVTPGESMGSVTSQLSAHHVIGSTLAFRLFDLVHGSPTVIPGEYALHGNESFAQVHAILAAGPNIEAVTVDRGLTLDEVAPRSTACTGTPPADSQRWPPAGPSIRSSRPRLEQP